jgi:hypothetical protein
MDVNSYVHKSVELLFHILGLVEVWSCRRKTCRQEPLSTHPNSQETVPLMEELRQRVNAASDLGRRGG